MTLVFADASLGLKAAHPGGKQAIWNGRLPSIGVEGFQICKFTQDISCSGERTTPDMNTER